MTSQTLSPLVNRTMDLDGIPDIIGETANHPVKKTWNGVFEYQAQDNRYTGMRKYDTQPSYRTVSVPKQQPQQQINKLVRLPTTDYELNEPKVPSLQTSSVNNNTTNTRTLTRQYKAPPAVPNADRNLPYVYKKTLPVNAPYTPSIREVGDIPYKYLQKADVVRQPVTSSRVTRVTRPDEYSSTTTSTTYDQSTAPALEYQSLPRTKTTETVLLENDLQPTLQTVEKKTVQITEPAKTVYRSTQDVIVPSVDRSINEVVTTSQVIDQSNYDVRTPVVNREAYRIEAPAVNPTTDDVRAPVANTYEVTTPRVNDRGYDVVRQTNVDTPKITNHVVNTPQVTVREDPIHSSHTTYQSTETVAPDVVQRTIIRQPPSIQPSTMTTVTATDVINRRDVIDVVQQPAVTYRPTVVTKELRQPETYVSAKTTYTNQYERPHDVTETLSKPELTVSSISTSRSIKDVPPEKILRQPSMSSRNTSYLNDTEVSSRRKQLTNFEVQQQYVRPSHKVAPLSVTPSAPIINDDHLPYMPMVPPRRPLNERTDYVHHHRPPPPPSPPKHVRKFPLYPPPPPFPLPPPPVYSRHLTNAAMELPQINYEDFYKAMNLSYDRITPEPYQRDRVRSNYFPPEASAKEPWKRDEKDFAQLGPRPFFEYRVIDDHKRSFPPKYSELHDYYPQRQDIDDGYSSFGYNPRYQQPAKIDSVRGLTTTKRVIVPETARSKSNNTGKQFRLSPRGTQPSLFNDKALVRRRSFRRAQTPPGGYGTYFARYAYNPDEYNLNRPTGATLTRSVSLSKPRTHSMRNF